MSFSIEGKTAVVTGAANGVGLSIARHFVERGANVMFADMDEARLEAELDGADAPNVAYFAGDLREKLTIANLLSATIDAFERVDILVNANRQMLAGDPLQAAEDRVAHLLEQNLMTSLRLTQSFAKRMIAQAEDEDDDGATLGSIINMSSIAARRTQPELLGYSVASAAVEQLTRSMAVALAPRRIRVNAIALGSVMSASLQNAMKENEDYRETIIENTPLSRIAAPSELADVAQFLASDGSGFVTGQIMTVDGGRTLVDPVDVPAH
ncbi:MAG: SDR family oxidoreductase [Rhodobacteraceae bacterium]|nr:SDR family oxidoreductase [Paracoccaceae bacterium]